MNFVYDSANRLLSRSVEGLAVESRTFTNRGQLASVSFSTGLVGILPALVASFSYDAVGRETSRTYGNGLNTTSGYTRADNLITSITVAGKPELSFGYSYDSNKNVTAEQRGGSMALYSWNATFDAMDRLNSQNDGAQTRSWSLDLVGNTTAETLNGTAEARTLNDMHAPTAAGNKAYTYDSNGQMTTKPGYTLVWDARNHLVSSTGSAGVPPAAASVAYRYDAFGNRVSKGSTRYLLVDNQVVAEFTGGASKQYCYGAYIDEVLAEKGSAVAYYHRNRQYNTVALTDAVGAIVEQYSTDAMGRVKAFDAAATAKAAPTATTVLFTGRVWDAETGLYYFRARYFEVELGVFISRDPLGFVDGNSVYQGWFDKSFSLDPSGLITKYYSYAKDWSRNNNDNLDGKPDYEVCLFKLELNTTNDCKGTEYCCVGNIKINLVVTVEFSTDNPQSLGIKNSGIKFNPVTGPESQSPFQQVKPPMEDPKRKHIMFGSVYKSEISKKIKRFTNQSHVENVSFTNGNGNAYDKWDILIGLSKFECEGEIEEYLNMGWISSNHDKKFRGHMLIELTGPNDPNRPPIIYNGIMGTSPVN